MAAAEFRFVHGHASLGDASAFARKMLRYLQTGKQATYGLAQQCRQWAMNCDESTAGEIDAAVDAGGVGGLPFPPARNNGDVLLQEEEGNGANGAQHLTLKKFAEWFVEKFSKADVKRAARLKVTKSWGQTQLLTPHFNDMKREIAVMGGKDDDTALVDAIIESISIGVVDALAEKGYRPLGILARDQHEEEPFKNYQDAISWTLGKERAYIRAAEEAGASQYWIGFKDRKLQTHPKAGKTARGVNALLSDAESDRLDQIEKRQEEMEVKLLGVQSSVSETKDEVKVLSTQVTEQGQRLEGKQDELLALMRSKGPGGKSWGGKGAGWNERYQPPQRSSYNWQGGQGGSGKGHRGGYNAKGKGKGQSSYYPPPKAGREWDARPVHPDLACWTCGGNHYQRNCTAEINAADPALQRRVNAVEASLRGSGPHSSAEIEAQCGTMEAASSWICAVRESTTQIVDRWAEASPHMHNGSVYAVAQGDWGTWEEDSGPSWDY